MTNTKIDWTKPIEYVDGSPARYLGLDDGHHAVTPVGCIEACTGNYYDDTGHHVYGLNLPIRNANPIAAAIALLTSTGYTVTPPDPMIKDREFVAGMYRHRGMASDERITLEGDNDITVNRIMAYLRANKEKI